MMMVRYDPELGELNKQCSTRLLQNLARVGISPWYARSSPDIKRGCAAFARYDPFKACFRILPNSPRLFQASLRSGLISNEEATLLSDRLLQLCMTVLPRYTGYLSQEILHGRVASIVKHAEDLAKHHFHEAHQNLFPDELYAALPWPLVPDKHLKSGIFLPHLIKDADIIQASKHPLYALTNAVDFVNFGPGFGLSTDTILILLSCLDGSCSHPPGLHGRHGTTEQVSKIMIPSFAQGLQGVTYGIFTNPAREQQWNVINQLQQFAATLEQKCAAIRQQQSIAALQKASNLLDITEAFLQMMPPVEHFLVTSGNDWCGVRMKSEKDYLAGYEQLAPDQAESISVSGSLETFTTNAAGRRVQVFMKTINISDGLDPLLALFRVGSGLAQVIVAAKKSGRGVSIEKLISTRRSLELQIDQGTSTHIACRNLYLIDTVIRHFANGEVLIYNDGVRKFMQQKLAKLPSGYQVCGRALAKFTADIQKLLPDCFEFEHLTGTTVKVRWDSLPDRNIAASPAMPCDQRG